MNQSVTMQMMDADTCPYLS